MSGANKADKPAPTQTMPTGTTSGTPQLLLAHHLKQLKLPTILREYDKVAREAAREGIDHATYLLRLVELELIDREGRVVERRIRQAINAIVESRAPATPCRSQCWLRHFDCRKPPVRYRPIISASRPLRPVPACEAVLESGRDAGVALPSTVGGKRTNESGRLSAGKRQSRRATRR
jgi:hypothetical protein